MTCAVISAALCTQGLSLIPHILTIFEVLKIPHLWYGHKHFPCVILRSFEHRLHDADRTSSTRELPVYSIDSHNREFKLEQETVALVQQSWKKVAAIAPQAAALFYQNLFEADPRLRSLFKGDMDQQGMKLMQMIGAAVGKLNDLKTLVPILQGLGQRHAGYGVEIAHYQTVGAALLKTLGQGLGEEFTPEVKSAWTSVYGVMAEVMTAEPVAKA